MKETKKELRAYERVPFVQVGLRWIQRLIIFGNLGIIPNIKPPLISSKTEQFQNVTIYNRTFAFFKVKCQPNKAVFDNMNKQCFIIYGEGWFSNSPFLIG